MSEYKRFTKRNEDGSTWIECDDCYIQDKCDFTAESCCFELQDRLAELEDKIENGSLIEVDKNLIGQGIVGIHHFTNGTYRLDFDENIVIGFTIDGVITYNTTNDYNDEFRNGMFFLDNEKGREEAEAKFKELAEVK